MPEEYVMPALRRDFHYVCPKPLFFLPACLRTCLPDRNQRPARYQLQKIPAGIKPNRRSIRLPGYDYAPAGWYFVTVCCKDRAHLFGEVVRAYGIRPQEAEVILSQLGWIVQEEWLKTAELRPEVELGEFVVMPNHFHANDCNVGADPCVGPCLPVAPDGPVSQQEITGFSNQGEHAGSPLHRVIQWFKTMVTNQFIRNVKQLGWNPFEDIIWQRNYYEHIIRNAVRANCNSPLHPEQPGAMAGG